MKRPSKLKNGNATHVSIPRRGFSSLSRGSLPSQWGQGGWASFQSPEGDSLHCHTGWTSALACRPTASFNPPKGILFIVTVRRRRRGRVGRCFNPPKGILFIVTLPFRLQTGKNAQLFAFFGPQMPIEWPQMAEKGLILHFRACPHAPKTGGMLGILPPPYPHRCRFVALYPPPVGVRRAENPRIAGSALTPRYARIRGRNAHRFPLRGKTGTLLPFIYHKSGFVKWGARIANRLSRIAYRESRIAYRKSRIAYRAVLVTLHCSRFSHVADQEGLRRER